MGHSQPLFLYFRLFYSIIIGRLNFADVGMRTSDLWCRKRPLYQLIHHQCPILSSVWDIILARKKSKMVRNPQKWSFVFLWLWWVERSTTEIKVPDSMANPFVASVPPNTYLRPRLFFYISIVYSFLVPSSFCLLLLDSYASSLFYRKV